MGMSETNGPGPHPRAIATRLAKEEFDRWMAEWRERHRLTASEEVWCLARAIGDLARDCAKGERQGES